MLTWDVENGLDPLGLLSEFMKPYFVELRGKRGAQALKRTVA